MTRPSLSVGSLVGLALLLATSGCKSGAVTPTTPDHWNVDGVPTRIFRHLTGYRADLHGSFPDYQYEKKKDINLTLRRHFLNNNPHNPLQPDDPSFYRGRRAHSPLPDALNYFHLESLVMGGALLAWTGAFVPLPVESALASIMVPGEFTRGVSDTFEGRWTAHKDSPPAPSEFRVKNR